MKRNEIKKSLEEELKNITVSNELKEKTLNNIYYKNNVYHFPYWIKNCTAIFIVSCLCLSIYLVNNKIDFNKEIKFENSTEKNYIEPAYGSITKEETFNDSATFMKKSLNSLPKASTIEQSMEESSRLQENSYITMDLMKESEYYILTEEEFLTNYPDAIKTNNGYLVTKNNETHIYFFKDGLLIKKDNIINTSQD